MQVSANSLFAWLSKVVEDGELGEDKGIWAWQTGGAWGRRHLTSSPGGRPSVVHSKKQAENGKAGAVTLQIVADTYAQPVVEKHDMGMP